MITEGVRMDLLGGLGGGLDAHVPVDDHKPHKHMSSFNYILGSINDTKSG